MAKKIRTQPKTKKPRNYAATDITRIQLHPLKRRVSELSALIADLVARVEKLEQTPTVEGVLFTPTSPEPDAPA